MRKSFGSRKQWRFLTLFVVVILAIIALIVINRIVQQIKTDEQKKVKIWAEAIYQKAELVSHTESFFAQVKIEEKKRVQLFTRAYKLLMEAPLGSELDFYYQIVADNTSIPIIITNEYNEIQHTQNYLLPNSIKFLEGKLLREFSVTPPMSFTSYGITYNVYYKESKIYSDLRNILENIIHSFFSEITDNSIFVPVIITTHDFSTVIAAGNIDKSEYNTPEKLAKTIEDMRSNNDPIVIQSSQNSKALHIFYKKSPLLKTLQYYPIIYFFIFFLFLFISYNLLSSVKESEKNIVWVGMAKETAHQLGTPISSLIAWVEYMKMKDIHPDIAEEMEKDIHRLEIVTQRFSKIGSEAILKPENISLIVNNTIGYLKTRSSKKIEFSITYPKNKDIIIPVNAHLIEWVIENLCKNAIDAMEGDGKFSVEISEDDKHVYIDFSDTGKGISKSQIKTIFNPGFTTKQRGWGLGLSLALRIIRIYHKGKIFVKSTSPEGTTFRVVLNK
ncbi:HAMP domain-containing histidine kinase [Bacteroidales bacterium OttesenSCG-928-C19]|nr:HAMP domain-containing histidine kinase [Bacteroidales bacterium OttesenSCG-928-C19]